MTSIYTDIAVLSPEERVVFEMFLKEEGVDPASVILPQGRDSNRFPLSYAQQRLWFLDQLQPGSPFYNIPTAVRLAGCLDIPALERSLNEVIRRHETLRTCFPADAGSPWQVINPAAPITIPIIDLSELDAPQRKGHALRLAREAAGKPFDLSTGPVFRATLVRLAALDHLLILTMHHIVADVWSLGLLLKEVAALYSADVSGGVSRLPELPVQYADFAVWQRAWGEREEKELQLAYWQRQLENAPPLLELPMDHPRPKVQTFRGAHQDLRIAKSIATALAELSRREQVTTFMTLLAAFKTLLSRYARQTDIVVGSPVANRGRREVESLIGFFANTLVLRTDLSGNPRFRELLHRVREVAVGAYAHQDFPFEQLVEELQPRRTLSHSPLFQVMFAFQNAPIEPIELPGLAMTQVEADSGLVHFDLTLRMWETRSGFAGRLEYNINLFEPATIRAMSRHFGRLLAAVAADPDLRIAHATLLSTGELRRVRRTWSRGPKSRSSKACVDALFAAQAARTPNAPAVVSEWHSLTYGALEDRACRLGSFLRKEFAVKPEAQVAVCLDRTIDLVVTALAIWKAGGVYVPLDPGYPIDRLAFMLGDTRPVLLITDSAIAKRIGNSAVPVLCLDHGKRAIDAQPATKRSRRHDPNNAAYIIFTSGSTGMPRGVVATHLGLSHYIQAMGRALEVTPGDKYLHTASFGFSSSIRQLMVPLAHGSALVLAGAEKVADPIELFRLIKSSRATIADFVPSYWRSCVDSLNALPAASRTKLLDNSLRLVLSASEPLTPELPRAWASDLHHGAAMVNMLGQTETTGIVTIHPISPHQTSPGHFVSVGRPISNTKVYVLDHGLHPVPPGVVGAICVGGPTLARGYWARPGATAERFVPDPFGPAGSRLYQTGDLGRFRAGGILEFVGREDHQVKVRGFRVELGEIEAQIKSHPDIRETAVVALEGGPGGLRLVAYVVPRETGWNNRTLRAFLQARLPAYMVPATFIVLDTLPRTGTNKVDRRALPPPSEDSAPGETDAGAPRTQTEEVLIAIWQKMLRVNQISVDDDFFELGGHSLLATQVISRVRDAFQIELPIRRLFEAPTVSGLAAIVDAVRVASEGVKAPPIVPCARQADMAPSFAQQRLWFLDQLDPGNAAYVIPTALRIHGPLNVEALEQSLNDVMHRHEVLRTRFRSVDGRPVASLVSAAKLAVLVTDLDHVPPGQREGAAQQLAKAESALPFDLQQGPLLRVKLLRLAPDDHILTVMLHHIVADGWSIGILIRELEAGYAAHLAGAVPQLDAPPVQYADFAAWQRQWLQGEVLERQLAYWRTQLAGAEPVLALPTDYPRPAVQSFRGAQCPIRLSKDLTSRLVALSRTSGATLFMTLLAAFHILLSRYSGQNDICVGIPIAGRTKSQLEGVIGCFVNTLVLRGDLSRDPRFRDYLSQVRTVTLDAYTHQDVPFEWLIEELHPEHRLSHTPLIQVMFALQNAPRPRVTSPTLRMQEVEVQNGTTKFDMTMGLTETSQGLWGSLEYNTDLFSHSTINRFCRHFETLLDRIVADPDCRIQVLSFIKEDERRDLLSCGRGVKGEYPRRPVHQVFESRAAETPDAVAVVCGEQQLTYRELNERANQLAHLLILTGVQPDHVVGVLMERSPAQIVSLLGILKAGAAYLPLDPVYPPARLRFMVEDAGIRVLLTQESLAAKLPAHSGKTICVDADWEVIAGKSVENPRSHVMIDHLAYVTYTSGSTGAPKAVLVPHRGVLRLLFSANYVELSPNECLLALAPLAFDLSTFEMWGALLHGARLALFPEGIPTPDALGEVLARHRVTTLWLTGSLFNVVVEEKPQALRGVRQLLIGGETLSVPHVRLALEQLPGTKIINGYGPTENTTFTTCYSIPNSLPLSPPSIPIGRPVSNTQVYLLDPHGQPVPSGVVGELFTGGDGLARGYHNRPALTAERFVPDPFNSGARLYRTGDLARWLPDGMIEFLGRRDHQVKVRGFRIELGEIEAVLGQHPAVKDAVVVTHSGGPAGKRLVAYAVLRTEPPATVAELRNWIQARMPDYMVPGVVIPIERLPLTPNQKIDRNALAPPEHVIDRTATMAPPSTEVEKALALIWRDLLARDFIDLHDNFFELGGHSLLASQLVSRACRELGVALPLRAVFQTPTVAGLAEHIEVLRWTAENRDGLAGVVEGQEEAAL